MTRKDYEIVADALAPLPIAPSDRRMVVLGLSAAFTRDNPRFDSEKFRERAEGDPGGRPS
jgi:hypothetical protein